MKSFWPMSLLLAATFSAGCSFENTLTSPTPLSETSGAAGSGSTSGNSSSASTALPASVFAGAWGSSTIAGLPLGNCSDVKWLINDQTASSVAGTVTANCASGVSVVANLTGTMQSQNVINLVAVGTLTAMSIPCQFSLNGTGTRQAGDIMKVDYSGSYCLGTVNGTETLRKFPNV